MGWALMKRLKGYVGLVLLLTACQTAVATPTPYPATPTATAVSVSQQVATATAPSTVPTQLPTATATPSSTPSRTPTATATSTPTATSKLYATIDITAYPPGTAVPTAVAPFPKADHITNIILLGNDVDEAEGGRTDSLILLSINHQLKTANMLSLPRDLYLLIPGWRLNRINLALPHGHGSNYPGAGGQLIKDTIEYNLGIPVDYYARIGFAGFKTAVDLVGGVEMLINCPLTDWRLISPDLDPNLEESWEQFTLTPGVQPMDGDLALWYARSRRTTNDFERGLRQQRLLQAILAQGLNRDMLGQIPEFWAAYKQHVETDIPLTVMVELGAIATAVQENGIQHLTLPYSALKSWRSPEGSSVQLLQWEHAEPILRRVMQPSALNRAQNPPVVVEVQTADPILYRQMADNLAWYGFVPRYSPATTTPSQTIIDYFGPNFKGANVELLSWLFHRQADDVQRPSTATAVEIDYRITLGYDANPCLNYLQPPTP